MRSAHRLRLLRAALSPINHIRQIHLSNMSSKPVRALIMGPPGSGKGTVSERIVSTFKVTHLSSGDVLRSQIKEGTEVGLKAKAIVEKGGLVPDEVMIELIMAKMKELSGGSWLLDGFPRTVVQAEKLGEKQELDVVINLDVPFETIIDRISKRWIHPGSGKTYNLDFNPPKVPGKDDDTGEDLVQRDDDKPETVRQRLKQYEEMTKPLIDFYTKQGILESFSGTETNVIWPKVKDYLTANFFKL
ncbi:GTP:AMP phosphotransferase AK3, mitochondrial-like [Pocillopora verrucosa]|uniref:GTP:AMP phosphotransferase AK3, mitochondrial-like n=1 Tax=Pocillopora verrucosa TaxID=203993 RepID=UPI002796F3C2|nr:GTP:AMP phosphotransferase AK3, mitochondrial-like [Pocillopora verrucosa]